jgi:ribosomal protein S18 acetylase RimI-like enzyme
MEIKYINSCDIKVIEQHGNKSLPIYYKKSDLEIIINNNNFISYKIINNEVIMGFIICEIYSNKKIHIMSLAILPEYRRLSLGTNLIDFIKNKYKDYFITLNVQQSNTNAINFYKKNNFTILSEIKNYYHNLESKDAFHMIYLIK